MPVLAKSCGIVMRMLIDRTFGTHYHAFYGDSEAVIGVNPVRVIQGDVPDWVRTWALGWVRQHESKHPSFWNFSPNLAIPLARQAARRPVPDRPLARVRFPTVAATG